MEKWYKKNPDLAAKMDELLRDLYRAYGLRTRLLAPVIGMYALARLRREERRLNRGWTYEPRSFVNKNEAALARKKSRRFRVEIAVPEAEPHSTR